MILIMLCLFCTFVQSETTLFEYVNHTTKFHTRPFSPIVNTIKLANEYGIDIYRVDSKYASKNNFLGGYRSGLNIIELYNVPELEYFNKLNEETLKHELIHAIQYCKGNKKKYVPLTDDTSLIKCILKINIDPVFIREYYPEEDFKIELEAYCFEKFISYNNINLLLNAFC